MPENYCLKKYWYFQADLRTICKQNYCSKHLDSQDEVKLTTDLFLFQMLVQIQSDEWTVDL